MTESNDQIPTWTGRAVTTSDLVDGEVAGPVVTATVPPGRPPSEGSPTGRSSSDRSSGQESPSPRFVRWLIVGLGLAVAIGLALWWSNQPDRQETVDDGAATASGDAAPASGEDDAGSARQDGTVSADDGAAPANPDNDNGSAAASGTGSALDVETDRPAGADGLDPAIAARYQARADLMGEQAWALYDNRIVHLRGKVPSQADVDVLRSRFEGLGSVLTVVEEYEIDPNAPAPVDPPLFMPELVRFEAGSTQVDAGSTLVVNAVPWVVSTFSPDATITIVSHPDSDNPSARELAEDRAEAIIDQWDALGLESSQVNVETGDEADDATGGGAEFVVRNLLVEG